MTWIRYAAIFSSALVLLLTQTSPIQAEPEVSAKDIVASADRVRYPTQPFRTRTTVTEHVKGRAVESVVLAVTSKQRAGATQYSTLVRYLAPARDSDKLVLFNGTRIWFYDPRSNAIVPISPQQRLLGQASDGDVLTVNLASDYSPEVVGVENVKDANQENHSCWRLNLMPSGNDAIYGRIETWIERGSYRPIKSKFYADSGRLLKTAYYTSYASALGADRPTRVIIVDAVNPDLITTIEAGSYEAVKAPDAWFQKDFLPRLAKR